MKKGFTLMELLIVMIIVAVMATVAIPQYRRAVERGRAMEGLTNARQAAENIITYWVINDDLPNNDGIADLLSVDLLKNNSFAIGNTISAVAGGKYALTVTRATSSGWNYLFKTTFSKDGIESIECNDVNNSGDCESLGLNTDLY